MIFCDKEHLTIEGDTQRITAELSRAMHEMVSDIVRQTSDTYEKVLECIVTAIVITLQEVHKEEIKANRGDNI